MSKRRLKLSRSFLELIFGGLGNSRAALWRRAASNTEKKKG